MAAEGSHRSRPIAEVADEFLTRRRIAVTGVSRNPSGHGSNAVYTRLRSRGYEVFAVNPNAETVEGDPAHPDLRSIPGGVDAVVIATRPEHAGATVRECAELGIDLVWMHRGLGAGSVDDEAVRIGRELGLTVIAGGCPLMFAPASDPAHRFLRVLGRMTRNVPARV